MPIDPKKLVFAREKFSNGWQDTGRWETLAEFATYAGMDRKSVTRIQNRENPVSLRVITKYAKALGYEVLEVLDSDTKAAAERSSIHLNKEKDWLYGPLKNFGFLERWAEERVVDAILTPANAHGIIAASTNMQYDSRAWDEPVDLHPIWLLDGELKTGSESLAKNIHDLDEAVESLDRLGTGHSARHTLSQIATNFDASSKIDKILASLRISDGVHVLSGQVTSYFFNNTREPEFSRWIEVTFPILLITSVKNVTAKVTTRSVVNIDQPSEHAHPSLEPEYPEDEFNF